MKEGLEKYFEGNAPETPTGPVEEVQTQLESEDNAVQQVQGETTESVLRDEGVEQASPEIQEEVPQEEVIEVNAPIAEQPALEVIENEETVEAAPSVNLPQGVEKLVEFMNETGSTVTLG